MSTVAIILLGFIAAIIFKLRVKKDVGDPLLGSIIFVPALLFWINGQSISELTGFGLSAKFVNEAKKEVSTLSVDVKDLTIFSLSANDPNFKQAAYSEACAEYFVTRPSKIPKDSNALVDHIVFASNAIKSSLACGRLVGVIVLDDNDRYIGSYDKSFFAESLSIWAATDETGQIDQTDLSSRIQRTTIFGASLKFPEKRITPGEGFVAAINEGATIKAAFRQFQKNGVDFLAVTDATGKFKGILQYRTVVQSLLSALLNNGK